MSFALTFTESTSLFTRDTSPLRQASNSSLKAPPMPLLPSLGLGAPEAGLETPLLPPPPEAVVLKLALLAMVGPTRSGEARAASAPPLHSLSVSGAPAAEARRAIGGEAGGAADRKPLLGGDWRLLCCEGRRGTAITAALAGDNKELPLTSGESAGVSGQLIPLRM